MHAGTLVVKDSQGGLSSVRTIKILCLCRNRLAKFKHNYVERDFGSQSTRSRLHLSVVICCSCMNGGN